MKKLLNVLYITIQGAYLSKERENVVVKIEKETKARFPIHTLQGIVCFGVVNASPYLMNLCVESGVMLSFLTENGKYLASIVGEPKGNVLLRKRQFEVSQNEDESVKIARTMIAAKIANSRIVVRRVERDHSLDEKEQKQIEYAGKRLVRLAESAKDCNVLAALRGVEGEAAGHYFDCFNAMIRHQKEDFEFRGRSRRPPLDPINALLSFLYTLLAHDVRSACATNGLDPYVGFLHRDRPGRASLALDLMEELRPYLADRLAINLINRKQVKGSGFRTTESGAVEMTKETRKKLLEVWQTRKRDEITHPFLKEKIHIGLIPHVQAQLLARTLRGDLDCYPGFIIP